MNCHNEDKSMRTCKLIFYGVVFTLTACVRRVEVIRTVTVKDTSCQRQLESIMFDNYLLKDYASGLEASLSKKAQVPKRVQKDKPKAKK